MIWWQAECKYGDMIRVCCGNFYHYGIFVSEDEVIQFGLPPVEGLLNRKFDEISVCVSDIETFSMGKMVEVASIPKGDKSKRLSPDKTISRARACIGEKGYHILQNNCEHFARYCYLGEKRCEARELIVDSWKNKSRCDMYLSKIPENVSVTEVFPSSRNEEINSVTNETLRKEKYWSWKTLEYALFRSFGHKISDLKFSKSKSGKWSCDKCFFSISHSGGYVAVAVSNKEIGIDIEEITAFEKRCSDEGFFPSMIKHVVGKKEAIPQTSPELLKLWTQKESIFKCQNSKSFNPAKIQISEDTCTCKLVHDGTEFLCSATGSDIKKSFLYYYSGEEASKIKDILWI